MVKAIKEAPKPQNVTELQLFLGIVNYYSRCLPNISAKLAPLYNLLHKNRRWPWSKDQDKAFQIAKEALQSDSLLVHSPYGIGRCVISYNGGWY